LIQLSDFPEAETLEVVNYASAGLVLCFIVATPVSLWLFYRKKADEIETSAEDSDFYTTWGALFYEFDRENKPKAPYTYFLFVVVRLLLAGSLTLLGSYPIVQAGANAAIILAYGLFTCAVRPNIEKTKQLLASITEAAVCIVFFGVMYFLNSEWEDSFYKVENLILWLVVGVILVQSATAILEFGYRVYSFFRQRRSAKVVNIQETAVVNRTQGVNITTQEQSPGIDQGSPLEFFRGKK